MSNITVEQQVVLVSSVLNPLITLLIGMAILLGITVPPRPKTPEGLQTFFLWLYLKLCCCRKCVNLEKGCCGGIQEYMESDIQLMLKKGEEGTEAPKSE